MQSKIILLLLLIPSLLFCQEKDFISIQQVESGKYAEYAHADRQFFDSLNEFRFIQEQRAKEGQLQRRVFGYHPYWGGSNYLNYRWKLLSDFCHFSYEVDPATGYPLTTHDWETSPAVDSALAHGVRVHLCVTLFSGHTLFFTNPVSVQNLIDQIILLVSSRQAHGVNIDVEALPSSQKETFLEFMIDLCSQMDVHLPGAEVSIAVPAVNWSEKFNIPVLAEHIDFFMVMGYDYYWSGSAVAGPVSPLYPMSGNYIYSFSRTISYYQSQGVPNEMLIMGVPYYAYQWKTEGQFAPSATTGAGSAYTYRYVRDNNSGHYSLGNKHWESNSFAPYFAFESNGWNQCFLDDPFSLGKKYDIVNRRNLAGIGIWALGYDNGHSDLWDLIDAKFTSNALQVNADTVFDTGGPAFDYYDDERYTYTLATNPGTTIYLSFSYLDTEENYDTLWIYDGTDPSSVLLGIYSGDDVPALIQSSSERLTLKFFSDGATTDAGWRAVYDTLPVSDIRIFGEPSHPLIRPNPSNGEVVIAVPGDVRHRGVHILIIGSGNAFRKEMNLLPGTSQAIIDVTDFAPGLYLFTFYNGNHLVGSGKFIVK